MKELSHHYQNKIDFLIEFTRINSKFIDEFADGSFEKIDLFYEQREKILKIIQFINKKIELKSGTNHKSYFEAIVEINRLVELITKQDFCILSLIDQKKAELLKDIQSLNKNKKTINSYKTKVDHRQFDEKA